MGFLLFLVKISLGEKKGGHVCVPASLGARGSRASVASLMLDTFSLPRDAKVKLQLLSIQLQQTTKRNEQKPLRWGPASAGLGGLALARQQVQFTARRERQLLFKAKLASKKIANSFILVAKKRRDKIGTLCVRGSLSSSENSLTRVRQII